MKLKNVRSRQWERMIRQLIKHPSVNSIDVPPGYDRHYTRLINKWARRNVR